MTGGILRHFRAFFYAQAESCSRSFISSRPPASNANRWQASQENQNHLAQGKTMEKDYENSLSVDKDGKIVNEFSWSKSRDNVFKTCRRMYYLNYYAYWGGWSKTSSPSKQELYTMKKLSARPLTIGSDVHETTEWIIRRLKTYKQPVSVAEALRKLRYDMTTDWLFSMKHYYFTWPKETPGLAEHYYKKELDFNSFEEDYSHAEKCIKNIYSSEIYQTLAQDISAQVIVEKRDSMDIAGVKVWIQSDLIVMYASGNIEIVDWKTGKDSANEDVEIQLGIYALYVKDKWNIPPSKISVREVNLYSGTEKKHLIDQQRIEQALRYVRNSIFEMKKLLLEPTDDNKHNKPLPSQYFPMTEDVKFCRNCNFRGKCHQQERVTSSNMTTSVHLPIFEKEYDRLNKS